VFVEQSEQRGTGDAAAHGMSAFPGDDLDDDSTIVVLPGDAPLLQPATLDELVASHVANGSAATLLTSVLEDPTGYGRVIKAPDGRVLRIVEQRDAGPAELEEREVATSIYAFRRDLLGPALRHLSPDNSQGEFYLTDVVGALGGMGHRVGRVQAPAEETQGVNDRWQLALAERELRSRTNRHWLLNGVTMLDPRQTFVDVTVTLGRDVTLYPGTILEGNTVVGDGSEIGPDTRLDDCVVGRDCLVQHAVGMEAEISDGARVGPYAYLPAGSHVGKGAVTGAFYTAGTD
jgi:bifunctional UDP-N-acetylglucosamine pyrophosphorylase/glucosamine-1-phosphate N-acetyltransferase